MVALGGRLWKAPYLIGVAVAAALGGALIGYGYAGPGSAKTLAVLVGVAAGGAILARGWVAPAAIVTLTGAAANALPGPPLSGGEPVYAMVALVPVLAWAGRRNLRHLPRWLWISCAALFLWWLMSVMRAWAIGAPAVAILRFAADLGLFPLLLVGFTASLMDDALRRQLLVGFGLLALWVAVVNGAAGLGLIPGVGGYLAHGYRATPVGGIVRLYAASSEITAAAIPFALGAAVLARSAAHRALATLLLLVCLGQVLLGLGRVQWGGTALMGVVMLLLWGRGHERQVLRLAAVFVVLVVGASQVPALAQPIDQVAERSSSIFESSSSRAASERSGDTLAFRDRYKRAIRASMSTTEWVFGHGFLPSPWYGFAPDATRSLRNSDLGWYNALNTMGLIGAALVFAPVLLVALACWRARHGLPELRWLAFGGMGYALYALSVSQTLVVLFSPFGLAIAAAALGLGLGASLRARPPTPGP